MKTITGEIYLKPGEICWGNSGLRVRTVLGSCIALCFWHPVLRVGGMSHYMLPERFNQTKGRDGRYASEAAEMLFDHMRAAGTGPHEYMTKIFGGASILTRFTGLRRTPVVDVGTRNVEAAHDLIKKRRLNLISHDLGGQVYRRLIFDVSNGDVWLQKLEMWSDTSGEKS